jgi:hypothetical protein
VIERAREVLRELESERTVEHLEARRGRRPSLHPMPRRHSRASSRGARIPCWTSCARSTPSACTPLDALIRIADWKKKSADG